MLLISLVVLDNLSNKILPLYEVSLERLHYLFVFCAEVYFVYSQSGKLDRFNFDGVGIRHVEAKEVFSEYFTVQELHYFLLHCHNLPHFIFHFDVFVNGALAFLDKKEFILALALLDGPLTFQEHLRFEEHMDI
jgi:hypothetical protein